MSEELSITPAQVLATAAAQGDFFRPADIRAGQGENDEQGRRVSVALGVALTGLEREGFVTWNVDRATGDKRWVVTPKGHAFLQQEQEQ